MIEQPILHTERLRLRPFVPGDAADVQRLAGVPEVAATILNIPHPYLDGMAEEWIATHRVDLELETGVVFAVTLRADGMLVGAVGLSSISREHSRAELGYWIASGFWNQGYCTEAARAVLAYGFEELGLHRVHASYFAGNEASGRVLQKIGMTREGVQRHGIRKARVFRDLVLYAAVKD